MSVLKQIWQSVVTAFQNDVLDVEAFFVDAAKYAAQNIKPAVLKAVVDAVTAAEEAALNPPVENATALDKYEFAFSNAVAALAKDAIEFIEADINYAVEAVIQQRNARLALAPPPANDVGSAPTPTEAAPVEVVPTEVVPTETTEIHLALTTPPGETAAD